MSMATDQSLATVTIDRIATRKKTSDPLIHETAALLNKLIVETRPAARL